MTDIDVIAEHLRRADKSSVGVRKAIVTAITGGRLTVSLDGGTITALRHLNSYRPTVGDAVWLIQFEDDMIVLGKLGPGEAIDTWHNVGTSGEPAFQNNFANYSGAFQGARFRRLPSGLVVVQGLVTRTSAAPTGGLVIFALPDGYKPAGRLVFPVVTGEPGGFGRCDVLANGDVLWISGSTGATNFTSLASIQFSV